MAAGSRGIGHPNEDRVAFGPFWLDPARRLLTKDGVAVPLSGRAFEILLVLVRNAPEIVSKATLFERVWPGTFIEESTLRFHLWTLRKALGDGEDGGRYITTASGKGYCFVAPLSFSSAIEPMAAASSKVDEPGGGAAVADNTNLPLQLAEIVGRERELAELAEWLKHSRLVTLTGPGGVGKTRLSVEIGWRLLADFPAGVWLIDLAPLAEGDAVASKVASTLGISVTKTEATVSSIVSTLAKTRPLLIFDNCEHLAEAAARLIKTLLERAPGVQILTTSQRNLHLAVERVYGLDPLDVPPAGTTEIGGFAAVEFFVQRACAADRKFALTAHNGPAVAEICRQLDGLPLALEMAASRLRMLGVEVLRRGLGDRLKLLRGMAGAGVRHGSLHGMLDWSHGLLTRFDQVVFRRLAAFPGSFSLEAAVAVAGGEDGEPWAVVDALGRLVDQSLVTFEQHDPPRYRLLETMRLYATDKLQDAGETDALAERHARHFIEVFDEAEDNWEKMQDPDWIARYHPELDNLRAALSWALALPERRQIAFALAASGLALLRWLWSPGEGCGYLDRMLPLVDENTPPIIVARLVGYAAIFFATAFDGRGCEFADRAVTLYRKLADRPGLATALVTLAQSRMRERRSSEASALLGEARDLLAGSGLKKSQIRLMGTAGRVTYFTGDIAATRRSHTEAIELARAMKSHYEPLLLTELGALEYAAGDLDRAIELMREALNRPSSPFGRGKNSGMLGNLGVCLLAKGAVAEARPVLEKALSILIEQQGAEPNMCLRPWALLAGLEGRLPEAAQLFGYIKADRVRRRRSADPGELVGEKQLSEVLETGLPPNELEAWYAKGAEWSDAEAIEFVADRLVHRPPADDASTVLNQTLHQD